MRNHIKDTICHFRLDEETRIKEKIEEYISYIENSLREKLFAITSAVSQMTLNGKISDLTEGMTTIKYSKSLRNKKREVDLDKVLEKLINLKNKINVEPIAELTVSTNENQSILKKTSKQI